MIKKNILYVVILNLLLLSAFFVDSLAYAKEDLQAEDPENNEEIVSTLQEGINIIKDEIQRDEEVASHMILRFRAFMQLRSSLKEGITAKENLLEDLKLVLASTLPEEIESLQENIDKEKKIVQLHVTWTGAGNTKRQRKAARLIIKESIPLKKKILASFKKTLREFEKLLSETPPEKMEHTKISLDKIKNQVRYAFKERLDLWHKENYEKLYFYGTEANKLSRTKEKFIVEMVERPYTLQCCKSMVSNIKVHVVSPVSAVVKAKVGYIKTFDHARKLRQKQIVTGPESMPYDLAKDIHNGTTITQKFKMTLEEGSWRISHTNILYPRASTD